LRSLPYAVPYTLLAYNRKEEGVVFSLLLIAPHNSYAIIEAVCSFTTQRS
jgi:hypothetical protein